MPNFSDRSRANLLQCDDRLQTVFNELIKYFDFSVICGHRSEVEQEKAFHEGKSKARFGQSPHNRYPSMAVDAVPYPIDWNDTERMTYFAGQVIATARENGIALTWGKDWDGDTDLHDNSLNDYPHFELTGWRDMPPMKKEESEQWTESLTNENTDTESRESLFSYLLEILRRLFSSKT